MKTKLQFLLLACWMLTGVNSFAQNETDDTKKTKHQDRPEFDDEEERKGVKFNLVPLPSYDPATKWGATLLGSITYYPSKGDLVSPPSMSGIGGNYTSNGSYFAGFFNDLYLKEDLWRINNFGMFGRANQIYKLSPDPSNEEQALEQADVAINITMFNMMVERKIFSRVYAGLGYIYSGRQTEGRNEESNRLLEANGFGNEFINTHGLRYALTYDSRDNVNYPYKGKYINVRMDQMLGENSQNIFTADYRQFFTVGHISNVIAFQGFGRFVSKDAARDFWSTYGRAAEVLQRGYEAGRRMDRNLVNFQAEYRKETPWLNHKLGFVGSVGIGKVFGSDDETGMSQSFRNSEWLPAFSVGARYRLLPYERMNINVDYACGKDGHMFYFGISEFF
ncbi:BamA/TamA family outer membrane protein [Flammeovirga aprica]|uniref:BamA/TamA family outer membrane protein n=1 Tax=Flammeovirga aprica JL-4 TaxID=694437 RepID=A0A7X9XCM7_9BACT|nr:BamA/TamA family outer membrane protein [Flammeovirga aprica]NME71996.1 BamA/TamA family outer membrane protein [Flammeovirga aprica JL-4]